MKGRLYVKVLLALIFSVLGTAVVAAGLFRLLQMHAAPDHLERLGRAQAMLLSEIVLEKWQHGQEKDLRPFLIRMGRALNARFWLQDHEGHILFQTAPPGPIIHTSEKDRGYYRMRHNWSDGRIEFIFPLQRHPLKGVELHMLVERPEDGAGDFARFITVLFILGGLLALLAIPLSRKLAAPLQELRRSAHRIADGDLSERVGVHSSDEIGELASDFNRMAERVESMVLSGRHLTAHVSHELRSPLARLRLLAGMIEEDPKTARERAAAMELEIEDMDRLIGAILDYSRAGMLRSVAIEEFDPVSEVQSILRRQDPLLRSRALRFQTTVPTDVVSIAARRPAFRTLIGALVDNAVKFAPVGTVIDVQIVCPPGGGFTFVMENEYVHSAIHRAADPGELLKPFFREGEDDGYGLGLATARAASDALQGHIEISRSADGERGRFSVKFTLP